MTSDHKILENVNLSL